MSHSRFSFNNRESWHEPGETAVSLTSNQTLSTHPSETAKTYYDSTDADSFYSSVWGGEDIQIGIYLTPDETIREASRRTVERMASKVISGLTPSARVLDLGSGYGGAARYLAKETG